MLDKYVWNLYLKNGGQKVVDFFEKSLTEEFSMEYYKKIEELRSCFVPINYDNSILKEQVNYLIETFDDGYLLPEGEYTERSALSVLYKELYNAFKNNYKNLEKTIYLSFMHDMDYYSILLSIEYPDLFIPYHFRYYFNVIELIAQEFDINLPTLPAKNNYIERFFYFSKLMEAFNKFKRENSLSPYELCAFLYDFAPKYIGGVDSYIIKDLPKPKRAYFVGGTKKELDSRKNDSGIIRWQCSSETKPGDMIVMYLKSPISAVSSVWRSISYGFVDPFADYYHLSYITNEKEVQKISLKQMKQDKILKSMSLIRKNMQGVNGVEFSSKVYNHLIDLTKADVPKLEPSNLSKNRQFLSKKEVENQLIKPLIKKLGYDEKDYTTKLRVPIGNNKISIPNFIIQPSFYKDYANGEIIIEVVHSIPSSQLFIEIWKQTRNYAKYFRTKYYVIASKEAIWVYSTSDNSKETEFIATWDELENPNNFQKLYKILGKK